MLSIVTWRPQLNALRYLLAICLLQIAWPAIASEFGMSLDKHGMVITIDGKLFTRYVIQSGTKPILHPIVGPTGKPMTRGYPILPLGENEKDDHIHHRSVWFGYEGIQGLDYWHEPSDLANPGPKDGKQVHRGFTTIKLDGDTALLVANTDYVDRENRVVAKDERSLRFGVSGEKRWIDYTIKLWSPSGPLVLDDTKEGALAVRVAGTMKVEAKLGGQIINSSGDTNKAAWGKPAAWVDYHGTVAGQTVGIAILTHPTSLQAKPRWHVRPYGLFAANPIGASNYSNGNQKGGLKRPEGEPIVLRHRIVLHKGDPQTADIAGDYLKYIAEP